MSLFRLRTKREIGRQRSGRKKEEGDRKEEERRRGVEGRRQWAGIFPGNYCREYT